MLVEFGLTHRLGTALDVESPVGVLEVLADGSRGDLQRLRNLFVGHPKPDQPQDFPLPMRERDVGAWRGRDGLGQQWADVRHEQGHQEPLMLLETSPALACEQQTTCQPWSIRVADQ